MAKRGAEKQLNYDNWDEPDEPVESEKFEMADEETLKARKLIVPRRRITQLPKPTLGLFKSFDGFRNSNNPPSASFIFKLQNESPDDEYLKRLAKLNTEVSAWISKHVSEDPYCILTPIFTDYASHLASIQSPKGTSAQKEISTCAPIQPSANTVDLINSKPNSVTEFATPKSSSASAPTNTLNGGFSFKLGAEKLSTSEATTKPPSFNFGSLAAKSISELTPSHPVFSFSPSVPQKPSEPSKAIAPASSESAEDEEYVPPKSEVKEIVEDGSVYQVRCKLFFKKTDQWTERGLGNLYIIPSDDEKLQLLVRADTNLGNILLNIFVSKEMPMHLQKNNLTFACIPSPPLPGDKADPSSAPRPVPFLVRVKTEEAAKQLLAELDKHRGK